MINTSLRTQLQTKVSAATSAMSRSDLMLLRVAAQGLNIDESNLDALLTPKVDAITAADLPVNFVEAWRSLGLDGNVMYQFPFDTQPGDTVFIDPMGLTKKSPYPSNVVACSPVATGLQRTTWAATRVGSVQSGRAENEFFAAVVLSDGNHLVLSSTNNSGSVHLVFTVVDAAFEKVLHDSAATPAIVGFSNSAYSRLLGIFETSANVFRVYMSAPGGSGEPNSRVLGYFNLTYNTGTKQVTYSAGSAILTEASGEIGTISVPTLQGLKYTPFFRSGGDTYCLDMQASTTVKYTSLSGKTITALSPFDHGNTGNEFARAVNSTDAVVQLVKAGVNTVQSLPANLTSDGCFSAANDVRLINDRMWLCYNATTKVVKVVEFNAAYTSCDIYSVGTLATPTPTLPRLITRQSNQYVVYGDGMAFSFRWASGSAPNNVKLNQRFPSTYASPLSDPVYPVLQNTQYVAYGAALAQLDPSSTTVKCYIRFDKAEYLPGDTKAFGVITEGAAANGWSEVALLPGTVKSSVTANSAFALTHTGLLTTFSCEVPHWTLGARNNENTPAYDVAAVAVTQKSSESVLLGVAATGNGVYAVSPDSFTAAIARPVTESGSTGQVAAITARGLTTFSSGNASLIQYAAITLAVRSAAIMVLWGTNPTVYKEGARK